MIPLVKERKYKNPASLRASHDIDIELENDYNYEYYATLRVGTAKQEMTFLFDTGSSETYIPTTDCDDSCNRRTRKYDTSSSKEYQLASYRVHYMENNDGGIVGGYPSTD